MDTLEAIAHQRVIRRFTSQLIPAEALTTILNAGRRAGSSKNLQRWAFVVVRDRGTLERLSNKFRTGNNFSDTRLSRLGDAEAELWCNQVSRPGWYMGIIGRGLELAGAKDVQVALISSGKSQELGPPSDDSGARFSVRWK